MMSERPQRKSPRLKGYDYTQSGAYFITICTNGRQPLFGEIQNDEMSLSPSGHIAADMWAEIPSHYPTVELDAFVVMPNHIHGILILDRPVVMNDQSEKSPSLGHIVGSYKSAVTQQLRKILDDRSFTVWQRSYHDHIIRTEASLYHIRRYIVYNPASWTADTFYNA